MSSGTLLSCILGIAVVYIGRIDLPLNGGIKVVGFIPKVRRKKKGDWRRRRRGGRGGEGKGRWVLEDGVVAG